MAVPMAKVMTRKTRASLHLRPEVARRQGTATRARARVPVRKRVFSRFQRLAQAIALTPKMNFILTGPRPPVPFPSCPDR